MQVYPLQDRIIVQPLPAEQKMGDLYIPEGSQERPARGIVIAAGRLGTPDPLNNKRMDLIIKWLECLSDPPRMNFVDGKPDGVVIKPMSKIEESEEMVVEAGDTLLYGKYAGQPVNIEGTEYLILKESECLAVIKKQK